jgi:hypothetical protein
VIIADQCFLGDCADHQVSLLESIFGAEKDVLRSPDRLRFDKINYCSRSFADRTRIPLFTILGTRLHLLQAMPRTVRYLRNTKLVKDAP